MAWVSFVIVALIFVAGQEDFIPHDPFGFVVPFLSVPVNIPYSGYLRMLVFTVILWAILWMILSALEQVIGWKVFEKAGLRNGLLFASRPSLANNLAVILASLILGYQAIRLLLDFISEIIRSRIIGFLFDSLTRNFMGKSVGAIFDFASGTVQKGDLKLLPFDPRVPVIPLVPFLSGSSQPAFPIPIFPRSVLVLCFLTLIVAYFFRREQRARYESELRRNQRNRKRKFLQRQDDIPLSED